MRFESIDTPRDLGRVRLTSSPVVVDTETDGLDERSCKLLRVVVGQGDTAYSLSPEAGLALLPTLKQTLVLQNFKFDFKVLKAHGVDLFATSFRDTMLMHHLIDENSEHSLDFLVKTYCDGDNYKEVFWSKYDSYQEAPREEQLNYECKDVVYTGQLFDRFSKVLEERGKLVAQVHELARHLALTEYEGVCLDVPTMLDESLKIGAQIDELGAGLRPLVGEYCQRWEMEKWYEEISKRKSARGKSAVSRPVFNFGSNTQIQWLLYSEDALHMPVLSKTKAGHPATDYEALSALSSKHPVIERLRDFKSLQTISNTFITGLLERQKDGKVYPSFNINGTHTGRISSSDPNLQNMPKDGPYRGFFIPSENQCFFGADYSQLEVVIEANLSGDKQLRKMLLEGASKHDITNDELKLGDRNLAKTLNFAMQYWCSPYKVKELLDVSQAEANSIYNKYWEVYKGVRSLKAFTDKRVDDGLPIVSPFGRERNCAGPFFHAKDEARAKRQAYNALIQGTGADITHLAFGRAAERIRGWGVGRMLWPIHDELLGECKTSAVETEKLALCEIMEQISTELEWDIPLKAVAYGPLTRWTKA